MLNIKTITNINNTEDSILDQILGKLIMADMLEKMQEEARDLPEASPLDLLSRADCARMDEYLSTTFAPFRKYIDPNYVALLIALSEYEEVDITAKIREHILHNATKIS